MNDGNRPRHDGELIRIPRAVLEDRILGAWAGKSYGAAMGEPLEFAFNGRIFLGAVDVQEHALREWLVNEDDLYMNMANLAVVADKGLGASSEDFAIPYREGKFLVWHANGQARQNVLAGIPAELAGHPFYNPHADDIDFQIECDYIGMISPGLPEAAQDLCRRQGRVVNYGDGIYGGMFFTAMYAAAWFETDTRRIVELGRQAIPVDSRYGLLIDDLLACHRDRPDEQVEYRAPIFVIASGYVWSSHLLLLSASSRFPDGLANRSGLVGRYLTGHSFISAFMETDTELYPGMMSHSLVSRNYFRCPSDKPFVRHDLRVWENEYGQRPRLRNDSGSVLLGDELLDDWRSRTRRGIARVRAYYDVHPARDSALTLDQNRHNRYGDPLPRIEHRLDEPTRAREAATKEHILDVFRRLAGGRRILDTQYSTYLDHPCGGCRMGTDPSGSVCDSFGRTHDHENLFVVGASTLPTGGCTNGTLTFSALTLRSAEEIGRDLGWQPAETEPGSVLSGAP